MDSTAARSRLTTASAVSSETPAAAYVTASSVTGRVYARRATARSPAYDSRVAIDVQTEQLREQLNAAEGALAEAGEVVLDSGLFYADGDPVRVRVRKRERRYELDDEGAAVRKVGVSVRHGAWYEAADRVVDEEHVNVNRRGVVFVPAVEGRDLAALALQVARASASLYAALLEISDT